MQDIDFHLLGSLLIVTKMTQETLDAILVKIGEFGRYQKFIVTWICFGMILNAADRLAYVFTAQNINYR